jgi:hypothetical protein
MSDFLTIMRVSLIPALERMVDSEEKHLNYLKGVQKIDVSRFILESEAMLSHLKQRLSEYQTYLKENIDERRQSEKALRERSLERR